MSANGLTATERWHEDLLAKISTNSVEFRDLRKLREEADDDAGYLPWYRAALASFVKTHGAIRDYFTFSNAAIAVTAKARTRPAAWLGGCALAELHVINGPLPPDTYAMVERAWHIAHRAERELRSRDRLITITEVSCTLSQLLGFAATTVAGTVPRAVRDSINTRLNRAEADLEAAAIRGAQLTYLGGMVIGLLPLFVAVAATGALLDVADVPSFHLATYVATAVAGGLGAIVSVTARLASGASTIEPYVGRAWIRILGILRPLLGGIFGVIFYFALSSELLAIRIVGGPKTIYAFTVSVPRWFQRTLGTRPADRDEPSSGNASARTLRRRRAMEQRGDGTEPLTVRNEPPV